MAKEESTEYEVWTVPKNKSVMRNHCSYHGEISGAEATDRLLASKMENCYLTRFSKTKKSYMLTIRSPQVGQSSIAHFKLKIDNKKCVYEVESTKQKFSSIDELLSYYETNPLSEAIRRIGKPCFIPEQQRKREEEEMEAKEQLQKLQEEQRNQQELHQKEVKEQQRQQQQLHQLHQQEMKQQQEMIRVMMEQQKETQKQMQELKSFMQNEITEQKKQLAEQQDIITRQQDELSKQKSKIEEQKESSDKEQASVKKEPNKPQEESNCAIL